mmetsp:Transcript_22308/g.66111  ORF Transcript_22308/g.66111 Transcript_22308/m.66111 type:complete len:253 (-) Transcript_22308:369-1127(-)
MLRGRGGGSGGRGFRSGQGEVLGRFVVGLLGGFFLRRRRSLILPFLGGKGGHLLLTGGRFLHRRRGGAILHRGFLRFLRGNGVGGGRNLFGRSRFGDGLSGVLLLRGGGRNHSGGSGGVGGWIFLRRIRFGGHRCILYVRLLSGPLEIAKVAELVVVIGIGRARRSRNGGLSFADFGLLDGRGRLGLVHQGGRRCLIDGRRHRRGLRLLRQIIGGGDADNFPRRGISRGDLGGVVRHLRHGSKRTRSRRSQR